MKHDRSKKGNSNKIFISVSQRKLDILSTLFSFFVVWKVYWCVFDIISPQDTIVDILAVFGMIVIIIPCTVILKSKILDFLKK